MSTGRLHSNYPDMTTEDLDWEPPTEAEMKLIEARRERSDQISKLMAGYLLKGYKMLGTVCGKCDTILLQDRQRVNYCVACSELDSDTRKDDPVMCQSAAISMAKELELASATVTPQGTNPSLACGSGPLSSPATKINPSLPPSIPTSTTYTRKMKMEVTHNTGEDSLDSTADESIPVLSMSSIDVQSYPATVNKKPVVSQNPASSASCVPPSKGKVKVEDISKAFTGVPSEIPRENFSQGTNVFITSDGNEVEATSSESIHIIRLMEKIQWASMELSGAHSVEYSIQLCQLMKKAGNAIVALRKARV